MSSAAFEKDDMHWMREALSMASQSIGISGPNPRVGCVIVAAEGRELGRGFTQPAGQAHAEVQALHDAKNRGKDVRGATVYVTLEPCSHYGRTPPCCDALIAAGIARVVSAVEDPNPAVRGSGHLRLRQAGVKVQVGVCEEEARDINIGFFCRMLNGRPWVRLKSAASLDGRTALSNGVSQWITGEEARIDGHRWRQRADVIVTGVGTVVSDNPRLDVRHFAAPNQPRKVVIDSTLRSPLQSLIFEDRERVSVYTSSSNKDRISEFRNSGISVVEVPGVDGRVDIIFLLEEFAKCNVNEVHVEAGARLSGEFIMKGLVDEHLLYLAPKFLGDGLPIAHLNISERIDQVKTLRWHRVDLIGEDLRIVARV